MHIIIPTWFFGYDSLMFFISSIIGFFISFNFHKLYKISYDKNHLNMHVGFFLLSLGLMLLSISNTYSYITFMNCQNICILGFNDYAFSLEDFSYFIYFGLSITAYILFVDAYKPKKITIPKGMPLVFLFYIFLVVFSIENRKEIFLWHSYSSYFHLISLMLISFVLYRNIINYSDKKNLNSLLVCISFFLLSFYHLLNIFAFMNGAIYVFDILIMQISFILLLFMILRVKK